MTDTSTESLATRRFSRRTVAKGAVWSVPVIASVALAPQAAASATATVSITPACLAGNGSGTFTVRVTSGTLNAGTTFAVTFIGVPALDAPAVVATGTIATTSTTQTSNLGATVTGYTFTLVGPAATGSTLVVTVTPISFVSRNYRITGPTGDGVSKTTTLSINRAVVPANNTCTPGDAV